MTSITKQKQIGLANKSKGTMPQLLRTKEFITLDDILPYKDSI